MREDWVEVELREVCEKAVKVNRKKILPSESLIYLDIGGIDNLTNTIVSHKAFTWKDAPSRAQQIVRKGDVLFSTVRTYLRNIAQIKNELYDEQIASSGFTIIRSKDGLSNSNYLFHLSLFDGFLQPLNEMQTGTSYPAVRDKDVFAQKICLPPLPEQRAIVAKIEELFSELDSGIQNLKTAQAQLKIYRQAVLKKAFEGGFSEGGMNNDQLNLSIAAEPQETYVHDASIDQNIQNADRKKLPSGWRWVKFGQLFKEKPQNGLYKPSTEYGIGTRIIRIDGFYDGVIKEGYDFKRVKLNPEEISKYALSIGDILINRVNSMSHLGKCGLVKYLEEETVFESNIMKVQVDENLTEPNFIKHYLSSTKGLVELTKNAKQAVNQASINQQDISNVQIPICSLEEQLSVIKEIESGLSVCDKMEESITESLEKAEALRQSILKKAFEGKLLSEAELAACRKEPDWEPAGVLLEKLKTK